MMAPRAGGEPRVPSPRVTSLAGEAAAQLVDLVCGPCHVTLDPSRGGSLTRFDWRDRPIFRRSCGASILDVASFPLVPYSNRITGGRFAVGGVDVGLRPNADGFSSPLHGHGWQRGWEVVSVQDTRAYVAFDHRADEWPWNYRAEQIVEVHPGGYAHTLSLENTGGGEMPAGLGLHPYLPRTPATRLVSSHAGRWRAGEDGIPTELEELPGSGDWWSGRPVGQREVDATFTGRRGPLRVEWPETGVALDIIAPDELGFTVVYVPASVDYFCVEPVSHMTDAVNRPEPATETGLRLLAPGEKFQVTVEFRVGEFA